MTPDVDEVILSILTSDVKDMHLLNSITLSYGSIMPKECNVTIASVIEECHEQCTYMLVYLYKGCKVFLNSLKSTTIAVECTLSTHII